MDCCNASSHARNCRLRRGAPELLLPRAPMRPLHDLKQAGSALPAAYAHRYHSILHAAPTAFYQSVSRQAGATHSVRMPNRDSATVDVEPVQRNAQAVRAVQHLDGERFIQLPQANVVDRETCPLEKLRDGEYRPNAHLVRLAPRDCETPENPERLQSAALGE